jgi:Domain of unknown function (DUF4404)
MSRSRQETLRELLARVHERLSHTGQVDAEARQLLTKLMRDIARTLEAETTPVAAAEPSESGPDALPRLEALAVRFETEHPALGQVLRQLIDFLSKAGI